MSTHASERGGSRPQQSGAYLALGKSMSGRGHRGKRPRGDGTRGPRSSSCSGQPRHGQVSLLLPPMPCMTAPRCLVFSMLWLYSSAWHLHILPLLWCLLPWVIPAASFATVALFVILLLPFISFLLRSLMRLVLLLHHPVVTLLIALHLFAWGCSAAPAPTPAAEPLLTPVPAPKPEPSPSLQLQAAVVSSSSMGPTFIIRMGAIVLFSLATAATAAIAHACSRSRHCAIAPCERACCASPFPPPRRRRSSHLPSHLPPPQRLRTRFCVGAGKRRSF